MAFKNNAADEIKSRCSIVDVVSRVVPLKRAGSNYKGVCPFHNEKTPSLVVSDSKQIFTCFGCGATGDVIEFVKRYYNLDFVSAMEKLAGDYGIQLEVTTGGPVKSKDEYYEINRMAARFFYDAFTREKNPGLQYMLKRGIEPQTLKKFGIGYADGSWDSLYQYFVAKGTDPKKLLELGLISESKGKYYDKFRDRVMFPIINTNGKVIGFGGRTLGDGVPKYLNSSESLVFQKKNNIYGLNLTRSEVSREDLVVLVEGYMDAISLYQHGITNVGATLGTALTENQAGLIKRYTKNVVLAYDSDNAGVTAAVRGIDILYKEGCKPRVLHVTSGKDPDEFVKAKGKEAFLKLIKDAVPYEEYKLSVIRKEHNLETTDGRVEFLKDAAFFLAGLTPVEADAYIAKLAGETGISEGAIRREITQITDKASGQEVQKRPVPEIKTQRNHPSNIPISMLEKNLLKLLLTREDLLKEVIPHQEAFESDAGQSIFNAIKEHLQAEDTVDLKKLLDILEKEQADTVADILENVKLAGKETQVLSECIKAYEDKKMAAREKEILSILDIVDDSITEDPENLKKIQELEAELMKIQKTKVLGGKL